MSAKVSSPSSTRSQVSLWIGASIAAARENVLLPWFRAASESAWQESTPTAVVVPFRSHAYALKSFLLERDVSLLGVHFLTPAQLRELLSAGSESHLPLREHLRLLLSIAAEECMDLPDDPARREKRMQEADFLAAKSVARAPDHLLRMIDRMGAAGWGFSGTELAPWREVEVHFQKHVTQCGFELIHCADRRAAANASQHGPLFANVLVTGFNAAHWPLWPLLQAGVASARQATVLLDDPADETRDLDETWVGSWEELFGEAKPVLPLMTGAGESLFSEAEMRGVAVEAADYSFVVGADATEQARAIAAVCLRYLAEEKCTRVGIIFAEAGGLARLVGSALERFEIPHNDGLAHPLPGLFEAADWRAWLELQRTPRLESFLRLFNALTNREQIYPGLSSISLERVLRQAYAEVLIDDLEILGEFCRAEHPLVAAAIESLGQLPARAALTGFLQLTENQCERLGWNSRWREIAARLGEWTGNVATDFSRSLYLRWLEEVAVSFSAERSVTGNHPYARVQLLTVPQACGQEWSHLIFAGWNEGSWPPQVKGEFAREETIVAFNQSVRQFNRHATRRGRHGEGHFSIRDGHTLYLGPVQGRQIALRQFETLLASATEGVTLAASSVQEGEPERFWNPSEIFTRLYLETTQRPLTQNAMRELQISTRRWLENSAGLANSQNSVTKNVPQTRVAYDQRRDPAAQSGEFDFAFAAKPNQAPVFSVSEFDRFISAPALVWMKHYLGVEAVEDDAHIWTASSGRWIHDWLKQLASGEEKTFSRLPGAEQTDQRLVAAANEKRAQIEALCRRTERPLPDWWRSGWENALFLARVLGERLSIAEDWPWMATEWKLDNEIPAQINDRTALSFRGRIDLILAREELPAGSLAAEELWVVDYKTGAKKALRSPLKKKLLDGSALQLSLYALAVRSRGAECVHISLLSPLVRPLQPQLADSHLAAEQEIFLELARMQQNGVFGMHGPLRGTFRFTEDYPLATLGVDQDTLEQRWELTHPALVRDEEEIFW